MTVDIIKSAAVCDVKAVHPEAVCDRRLGSWVVYKTPTKQAREAIGNGKTPRQAWVNAAEKL